MKYFYDLCYNKKNKKEINKLVRFVVTSRPATKNRLIFLD